jgi:flagellar hook-associated protein 2
VTASYDTNNDRLILTNKTTGNTGLTVSDTTGNLMAALGISSGTTTYGNNAKYTVNGGPTLTSSSNTLNAASSGIPGLSVTVNSQTTETITVANDTTSMTNAINDFISKYNQVITYIDNNTKVTAANGTVTTSLLSDDREFQSWGSTLRSKVFASVNNSGTIDQLDDLGIGFAGGTDQLSVIDSTKLQAALQSNPSGVASFFGNATSGFASQVTKYADTILGTGSGGTGLLKAQQTMLTNTNKSIDQQIARLQQQINAEQARLTASFEAMESAESTIQSQAAALTKALVSNSSSSSSSSN